MKQLFRLILRRREHLLWLVLTFFSMCLMTFSSQLEILTAGILTTKGTGQGSDFLSKGYQFFDEIFYFTDNFARYAYFLIAVALFRATSLFFQRFTTRLLAIKVSADLRKSYFEHLEQLPLSFFEKHHVGSLASRVVGDASAIAESINSCLTNYIQTPFTILSTLVLCLLTSWQLTLLILVGFPLIIFPILFLARRIKRLAKQLQENQEGFTSILIDFLSGIQTVKLFGMEAFAAKKYEEQNNRLVSLQRRAAKYDVASRPIIHTIGMFFLGSALVVGLYLLELAVAEVFVFCGFLYVFYEPIKKFAEENGNIQKGLAAAERMVEILSIKPGIVDKPTATHLGVFLHEIEFKDVYFRYEGDDVLRGVSFKIKKGEKVAIVGPTGSGKSTIAALLPRLFDPYSGQIEIDGKPLDHYTQKSLRDQIAFVPQKPFLFHDTIARNISYGRPYNLSQIQKAARHAHAEEFILKLPSGYETILAEGGKNLSGGQQQRLAIARALFKEAPILILDEATSALDPISEEAIQKALSDLRGSITQLVIAHRLSTVEDADKIIFLDRGQKIGEGTKDELLATCPPFKEMWELLKKPATG